MLRFGRALWNLLRHPLWRGLLIALLLGWIFDRAIFHITEAAWVASVEQGASLTQHIWLKAQLFAVFILASLGLSIAIMRVVARPNGNLIDDSNFDTAPLPRALQELAAWRRRVTHLGWFILMLAAVMNARNLSGHSNEWLQCWGAKPLGFRVFGIDAAFWVFQLPLFQTFLDAWWRFSVLAFTVLLVGGGLRSLPMLAARHPQIPNRWRRALLLLGVHLLLLRGLGYVLAVLNLGSSGLTFDEVFISLPLWILGLFLCFVAIVTLAQEFDWKKRRRPLLLALVGAFIFPTALSIILWPIRAVARGIESPFLVERSRPATDFAWQLKAPDEGFIRHRSLSLNDNWPIWDEDNLLLAATAISERGQKSSGNAQPITNWKTATLFPTTTGWHGLIIGEPPLIDNDYSNHDVGRNTVLKIEVLDPLHPNSQLPGVIEKAATPDNTLYGFEGRPLFANVADATSSVLLHTNAGVPLGNWGWKLAWAWRLRSAAVLFEGNGAPKMLVFRGAREIAEKLRPDLLWSEPRPSLQNGELRWQATGYQVSDRFPGANVCQNGLFAGYNFARGAVRFTLNGQTGAIKFAPFTDEIKAPFPNEIETARHELKRDMKLETSAIPIWQQYPTIGAHFKNQPAELAKLDSLASASGVTLQKGVPVIWSNHKIPLIGRGYFNSVGELKQVALKNVNSSTVVVGDTFDEALANLAVSQLNVRKNDSAHSKSLAAQALRTFREMDALNRSSHTPEFGRKLKKLERLLEQLAAGRK